jgi:hypothetical protein
MARRDEWRIPRGLRYSHTTNLGDDLDWGVVGQFTYLTREDQGVINGVWTPFEMDLIDVQIGMGPCWRPGPFVLYGGPMLQFIEGEIETTC